MSPITIDKKIVKYRVGKPASAESEKSGGPAASISSRPVSAKKVITVWLRGSCPFDTVSRTTDVGNSRRMLPFEESGVPFEGSEPRYCSTSGVTPSTLNEPTKKKVKSLASA